MISLNSVLIVDDSQEDRYILKRLLKKSGFDGHIFEASHGVEAIEFLRNFKENKSKYPDIFPPSIVFLDINMPLMNGFEFLDEFTALREQNNVYKPLICFMFTSSGREEEREKALSHKYVKDYLIKGQLDEVALKKVYQNP